MADKDSHKWLKIIGTTISLLLAIFTISPFLLSWYSSKPMFYGPESRCPENFTWESKYGSFTGYFKGSFANYGDIPTYLYWDFKSDDMYHIDAENKKREQNLESDREGSWFFPPIEIGGVKNISLTFVIKYYNLSDANLTIDLWFGEPFLSIIGLKKHVGYLPRVCEYEKKTINDETFYGLKENGENYKYDNPNFWPDFWIYHGYLLIPAILIILFILDRLEFSKKLIESIHYVSR